VAAGGEGLMLHREDSIYRAVRGDDLLKLKVGQDAEARVVGYIEGKGKYSGMMGALQVQTRAGVQFRLGTGFNDQQRKQPPAIGVWVTYTYQGVTEKGVPRFARFVRERPVAEIAP
jgi:DNA ligase-1